MPFNFSRITADLSRLHLSFMRWEKFFFLAMVIFNLSVIFSGKFFPTMDGPAHLHNSQIINSLLFEEGVMHQFYQFNSDLVPNWSGHFLLAFFNQFLPAFVAEKILLCVYLVGLPYAFRILIKTISPDNYLFSYLIFPFTYSFVFILGFYNFSLAIVLMLFSITFWIKNEPNIHTIRNRFILFILLTATFFSHLVVFGLTILAISLFVLAKELSSPNSDGSIHHNFPSRFKNIVNHAFVLLISSLPGILLSIDYFKKRPPVNNVYTSIEKIWEWITGLQPIIAYNTGDEIVYTAKLFYLLTLTLIISVALRVLNYFPKQNSQFKKSRKFLVQSDIWLFVAFLFLLFAILLPDSNSSAGYVTVRLLLLFFIFLIIWLACQKLPLLYCYAVVLSFLFFNSKLNEYYKPIIKDLNSLAVQCNDAAQFIPEKSIVAVHSYHDNWLANHFSNYLGVDKPLIILENYECATDYFPLQWHQTSLPTINLNKNDLRSLLCFNWNREGKSSHKNVDFVFLFGDSSIEPKACDSVSFNSIVENSTLVYQRKFCRLYKLKN